MSPPARPAGTHPARAPGRVPLDAVRDRPYLAGRDRSAEGRSVDESRLTEQECLDVLTRVAAARLAVTRRGAPYIELVGLIQLDGEPVVVLPEASAITHLLPAVVSPRRL